MSCFYEFLPFIKTVSASDNLFMADFEITSDRKLSILLHSAFALETIAFLALTVYGMTTVQSGCPCYFGEHIYNVHSSLSTRAWSRPYALRVEHQHGRFHSSRMVKLFKIFLNQAYRFLGALLWPSGSVSWLSLCTSQL